MRKKYFNDSFKDNMGFRHRTQLTTDLNRLSVSQVAEKYGVSHTTIRRWAKKFGIPIIHSRKQKRLNLKIRTVGLNETKEKRLYTENPIYNKREVKRRGFHDEE